jgi:DNA polymerase elongation subunit (family B)
MIGYRNIAYIPSRQEMKIWTWDASGNRTSYTAPYRPYIYVEDNNNGTDTSIYGTKIRKKIFANQYERTKFIREAGVKRLFENLPTYQQFLIDEYWQFNEAEAFFSNSLRIQFIDIEVVAKDEFPDPEKANHPINVITIYDTIDRHKYVWGVGAFDSSKYPASELTYINCKTETELLERMLSFFERDHPDVLSGWNSMGFDMPYIINRINNVMGEEAVLRLSPVGRVYNRAMRGMFGKNSVRWFIDGVSCLDYLDVYKRFQLKNRDSYRLDNIAQIEINERKIDYGNMHIYDLAEQNWQLFVEYNIHDVYLLQRLDEELKYIDLLRMLAYIGLTTFEAAMGAVSVINGAAAIRARYRDQKIATFIRNADTGKNPGAYVAEPLGGFQEYIVSFDANSLYPNLMISLNMSPETKIGKIIRHNNKEVTIQYVNGETFTVPTDKFGKLIKQEQIAISKAGILFSQKKKGIMPEMVDFYYQKRVEVKNELKQLQIEMSKLKKLTGKDVEDKKQEIQFKINRLDTKQLTIKVLINSAYGYFGNKHSPIGDDDIASSITLSGQAVIKKSNDFARKFLQGKSQFSDDYFKRNDPIVYNDTDSCYISLKSLVDSKIINQFTDESGLTNEVYNVCEELTQYLNDEVIKWAKATFNSIDPRLVFKREAICDVGLFLEKKRYALHLLDDEGFKIDKFKYTGVEVVRTTMPDPVKPHVKNIIETMMLSRSQSRADEAVKKAYDIFTSLPVEDIAFVVGLSSFEEYVAKCKGFQVPKGMPVHAKAAHYHNLIIKDLQIDNVKEEAIGGDKLRWVYVKKSNKYGISVIGFKNEMPAEFQQIFEIDYELMFSKIVFSVVERFYNRVGWVARRPNEQIKTDLFDLFA